MRLRNLTGIRGLAALWVALLHFQSNPAGAQLGLGPVLGGGAVGVDIFFVLSGFILSLKYLPQMALGWNRSSFWEFLVKRFARIYPLHLFTFLAIAALWLAAAHTGYESQSPVDHDGWSAICNLLLIHAWGILPRLSWNAPSWSVSAEWLAYIALFPLCGLVLQRWSWRGVLALTAILWFGFVSYVYVVHDGALVDVTTDGALRILPEFLGGYLIGRLVLQRGPIKHAAACLLAAMAGLAVALLFPQALLLLLPAILLMMAGLHAGGPIINRLFGSRVMVFLGEISYSIYMLHGFALILVNQLLRHFVILPSMPYALLILGLKMGLTLLLAWLGFRWIECPAREVVTAALLRRKPRVLRAPAAVPVSSGSYLPNLQVLRFIAALMVLFGHLLHETRDGHLYSMRGLNDPFGIEFGSGVDIFFVVSGFVMFYLAQDRFGQRGFTTEFIRCRLVRVLPMYWLFTSLMLLTVLLFPWQVHHAEATPLSIAASYLFFPTKRSDGLVRPILGLGWTLEYEIFFYACFAVAVAYRRRTGITGLVTLFLSLVILGAVFPRAPTAVLFYSRPVILEFLAGMLIAYLYLAGIRVGRIAQWGLIVAGFGLLWAMAPLRDLDRLLWAGIPACAVVCGAILGPAWRTRLFELGGNSSYSLYLSHPFTLNALALTWTRWQLPPIAAAYVAAAMVACVLTGFAIHRVIEMPLLKFFRRTARPAPLAVWGTPQLDRG